MSLLKFELKKIFRQRKLIWLCVFVLLSVGWFFNQNHNERDLMGKEAEEKIRPIALKTDQLYTKLLPLEREGGLTEAEARQFDSLNYMSTDIFQWKSAIYGERWDEIPKIEQQFYANLASYEQAGGVFTALEGVERDKAIEKNAYLLTHNLPFANEANPVSPALLTINLSSILMGSGGLLFLLLFFGNTYMAEKEQQTLLTLRTQPLRRWKLMLAKYVSLLVVLIFYLGIIAVAAWTIPNLFGEVFNDWSYPQILESDGAFDIIPAWRHLMNICMVFVGAAIFLFALLLLVGTQLKSSFSTIMLTGFLSMIGVVLTDTVTALQTPWNPFQIFIGSRFLTEIPDHPIGLYVASAAVWSLILFGITLLLREGDGGLHKAAVENKPYGKGEMNKLHSVWNSGLFEWRKSRRKGLVGQAVIVLSIAVVVGYFLFAEQVKQKENEALDGLASFVEETEAGSGLIAYFMESVESIEKQIAEANANGEDGEFIYGHNIDRIYEQIAEIQEEATLADRALNSYEKQDWAPFYDYHLNNDLKLLEGLKETKVHNYSPYSIFGYETAIAQKEWMKEFAVKPVFAGTSIPNIHDQWKEEHRKEKKWNEQMNRKVDHSGLFMLYMYFRDYLYFIPLLLFLILLGAGFSGERGKRPTIHVLQTLPIMKRSLFFGKMLNSSVVSIGSAVGVFLFAVLVGTVFNRFGDWMYPVLHYRSKQEVQSFDYTGMRAFEGGYHFIPLGEYVLKTMLLYVCVTLFLLALTNVLGLFIRQPLIVYILTGIFSVTGYLLSWNLDEFAPYSPFLYLNIPKIVNGEIMTLMNNPMIGLYMGCVIVLGATVFLLLLAYVGLSFQVRFVKKMRAGKVAV